MKQIQTVEGNSYHGGRSSEITTKLDIMPNEVFESLITDVIDQISEKDDFFKEIQLLDDDDLNVITSSVPTQHSQMSPHWRMETNPILYAPKPPTLRRIPAIYPCLACFQSLDSQQNFDEHMLKAHFNKSVGFNV